MLGTEKRLFCPGLFSSGKGYSRPCAKEVEKWSISKALFIKPARQGAVILKAPKLMESSSEEYYSRKSVWGTGDEGDGKRSIRILDEFVWSDTFLRCGWGGPDERARRQAGV